MSASAATAARAVDAAAPSTSLEVHGKPEEEEVDLDSSLIWAIRYLECDAVEEMLSEGANMSTAASACMHAGVNRRGDRELGAFIAIAHLSRAITAAEYGWRREERENHTLPPGACPGVTQRYLDCGLHEVATGDKDSVADQKARVFIAELLVQCGADPDNRQHGCGGTPLHHTRARTSNVPRLWKDLGLLRGARLALGRSAHSGGALRPTATVRQRPVAGSKPLLQSPLSTRQAGWWLSRARQVPAECGRRRQRRQPIRCALPRLLPLLSPQLPPHM